MQINLTALCIAVLLYVGSRAWGVVPIQDPWEESYCNLDATGAQVLGCWKFDELPLSDASGHGAQMILAGASLAPGGRFGGGAVHRGGVATRHLDLRFP